MAVLLACSQVLLIEEWRDEERVEAHLYYSAGRCSLVPHKTCTVQLLTPPAVRALCSDYCLLHQAPLMPAHCDPPGC
jgi:hypothetical protein